MQWRHPLQRRRFACGAIGASALLAGAADRWLGFWALLASLVLCLIGAWSEARTTDGLLTYRFPGTKRRSLLLAGGGLLTALLGLILGSRLPDGTRAMLLVSGSGFFLAGGGALAWHYGATYAGDRIVRLSDEDW